MKEQVIKDSKKLAYPKWKTFFDSVFMLGAFLLVAKLIIFGLNYFVGTNIMILEELRKGVASFIPLVLMVAGGIGSDYLKDKYID